MIVGEFQSSGTSPHLPFAFLESFSPQEADLLAKSSWDNGIASAVNKNGKVAGSLFADDMNSGSVVTWTPASNGHYTNAPVTITDWPSGRYGTVCGLSDNDYVGGYLAPAQFGEDYVLGQPFVYYPSSSSTHIEYIGTAGDFGEPSQFMHHHGGGSPTDWYTMVGSTPFPWIWMGDGVRGGRSSVFDLQAVLDPTQMSDQFDYLTGCHDDQFGANSVDTALISFADTLHVRVANSSLSITRGSLDDGTASSLSTADGDSALLNKGFVANQSDYPVNFTFECDKGSNGVPQYVRTTCGYTTPAAFQMEVSAWDWTANSGAGDWADTVTYDTTGSTAVPLSKFLRTRDLALTGTLSRYVSSTGKLRARVRARINPSYYQSMTWGFRFEQATFICSTQ